MKCKGSLQRSPQRSLWRRKLTLNREQKKKKVNRWKWLPRKTNDPPTMATHRSDHGGDGSRSRLTNERLIYKCVFNHPRCWTGWSHFLGDSWGRFLMIRDNPLFIMKKNSAVSPRRQLWIRLMRGLPSLPRRVPWLTRCLFYFLSNKQALNSLTQQQTRAYFPSTALYLHQDRANLFIKYNNSSFHCI